jgi:hypothetical protein
MKKVLLFIALLISIESKAQIVNRASLLNDLKNLASEKYEGRKTGTKGNIAAAVKMTVLGLLLGSVLAPLYIKLLMGATVSIDILYIFKQIAFIFL